MFISTSDMSMRQCLSIGQLKTATMVQRERETKLGDVVIKNVDK